MREMREGITGEHQVQHGDGDRRAWLYSASQVNSPAWGRVRSDEGPPHNFGDLRRKLAQACRSIELTVGADQLIEGKRAIAPAGIGQNPYHSTTQGDRLISPRDFSLSG